MRKDAERALSGLAHGGEHSSFVILRRCDA
jgi:hypothetical protein